MSANDPRKDGDTPIPDVHFETFEAEVRDYLKFKRGERGKGYTLEALFATLHTVVQKQAAQSLAIQKHAIWIEDHEKFHENMKKSASIPPMRDVANTGAFILNARDLQVARAELDAAVRKNESEFREYREAEQKNAIVSLRDERTWFIRTVIFGGIGAILLAIFVFWLSKH